MKKFIIGLLAITFAFFNGCKKEDTMENNNILLVQNTKMQSEMIPIAKLTDKKEIEHLFLQKDVQKFFSEERTEEKLIFVEIIDNKELYDEAGLLFRVYNEKTNVSETTISFVLTLKDDVYYLVNNDLEKSKGLTCTTSECAHEVSGCVPRGTSYCSKCDNGGKCTKTVSLQTRRLFNALYNSLTIN